MLPMDDTASPVDKGQKTRRVITSFNIKDFEKSFVKVSFIFIGYTYFRKHAALRLILQEKS